MIAQPRTATQLRYYGRPPAGTELEWWVPRVTLPDGEAVPLVSTDGMDYFLAEQVWGYFFPDWLVQPLVDGWWTDMHPDDRVVA